MVQFIPGSFTWATGIPADEVPPEGFKLEDVFPWALSTMEGINAVDSEQEHSLFASEVFRSVSGEKDGKKGQ